MRCPFFLIFLDNAGGLHLFRGGLVAHQGLKAVEDLGALGAEQGQVLSHEERGIVGQLDAFDGGLDDLDAALLLDLGDEYKDAEGHWYSKGITIVGFLLNNSLMEELGLTAPESWDDLTDSQYEGEIVMSNPAVSGTNYAVVNALLQAKGDEGWNYFEALNNNIAYYGKRGSDPKNKVSAGEFLSLIHI